MVFPATAFIRADPSDGTGKSRRRHGHFVNEHCHNDSRKQRIRYGRGCKHKCKYKYKRHGNRRQQS